MTTKSLINTDAHVRVGVYSESSVVTVSLFGPADFRYIVMF
jgi:hypothetical protein